MGSGAKYSPRWGHSAPILRRGDCEAAANALGLDYMGEVTSAGKPPGCFYNGDVARLNTDANGGIGFNTGIGGVCPKSCASTTEVVTTTRALCTIYTAPGGTSARPTKNKLGDPLNEFIF